MNNDPVDLLPVLYEAPTDHEQWQVFLEGLKQQMRARVACLLGRDEKAENLTLVVQAGADPEAQWQYEAYYHTIDTFYAYAEKRGFNRPGSVAPAQAFVSDSELLRTEFCNDFMLKFGMFNQCFALFGKNGRALANLSLIRGRRDGAYREQDMRLLRFLAPHMQREMQLNERFAQLQSESEARQAALNRIGMGVIFLDATGRVMGSNEAAARMLERRQGIRLSKGLLQAEFPEEERKLQRAIWQTCQTGAGRADGPGASLLISRRSPARPLQVVVGPACSRIAGLPSCPCAVIFVSDLSAPIRPQLDLLKALYGLTPAEARIALLLLDGKSNEQITVLLRITRNTLKTQTRSIFDKTGVRRQSQLIRLLMSLPIEPRRR
jgi:DNA-binding CsgD family transcriptional regulator/PAS domain-containing protein